MMGRFASRGLSRSLEITARTWVARVNASSSPTCPSRTQGKRLSLSGTTQTKRVDSFPIAAVVASTEFGSPLFGVSLPVRALNHALPRNPTCSFIAHLPLSQSTVAATLPGLSGWTYRAPLYERDKVPPARSGAFPARLCEHNHALPRLSCRLHLRLANQQAPCRRVVLHHEWPK